MATHITTGTINLRTKIRIISIIRGKPKRCNAKRQMVCIDEKSKELNREVREPIRIRVGHVMRAAKRQCAKDFAYILQHLADNVYAEAGTIVIVVDNLNTHSLHCLHEAFPATKARHSAERSEWHQTPEHDSWLNIAECGLSILSQQCLNRRIPHIRALINEVALGGGAWEQASNAKTHEIDWQFITHDTRIDLKRLWPILSLFT